MSVHLKCFIWQLEIINQLSIYNRRDSTISHELAFYCYGLQNPSKLIQEKIFAGWEMRGDWSSNAYPLCCAFPVSEARACSACSCFGEVLHADVHRSCLGICPHPHSKWCIQAHGTCHPDQLPNRPCQPHLFITMVCRFLLCILILIITSIFYIPRLTLPCTFVRISIPYPLQWGAPTFSADHAFGMMAAVLVSLIEVS